jgi:two-component system response regulator TctD
VLDLGLPALSGLEVLVCLRRNGNRTPLLILTARDGLKDRVRGLDLGADDYVLKPFDLEELAARIRALARRRGGDPSPALSVGSLVLDQNGGVRSYVNGRDLELRRREHALLLVLAAHAGKMVSRRQLIGELFGHDDEVAPNALDLYVARVRRKLEPDGPRIVTLRGQGYMLESV